MGSNTKAGSAAKIKMESFDESTLGNSIENKQEKVDFQK